MELEIKKIGEVFYLIGNVNESTVTILRHHFSYTYDLGAYIILNLDQVLEIDAYGMRALEEIYLDSKESNQTLCITGINFDRLCSVHRAA